MLVLLLACFRVVRKCCLLLLLPCQKVEPSCLTKSILFQWFQYSSRSFKWIFWHLFETVVCQTNDFQFQCTYIKWMIWHLKSFGVIPKKYTVKKHLPLMKEYFSTIKLNCTSFVIKWFFKPQFTEVMSHTDIFCCWF